jgi:hypothetical protein
MTYQTVLSQAATAADLSRWLNDDVLRYLCWRLAPQSTAGHVGNGLPKLTAFHGPELRPWSPSCSAANPVTA